MKDFTRDTLYKGRIVLEQPRKGYRFSIDAPLLTWFACRGRRASLAADLGAGGGVVGIGLLAAEQTKEVVAVEVQPSLAALGARNAGLNNMGHLFRVLKLDVRNVSKELDPGAFDLVVSNPPFWPASSGRLPSDGERRVAYHEVFGGIDDWIKAASYLLNSKRGRLCIVFPARRLDALLIALDHSKLSAVTLLLVHTLADKPAELVLTEARHGDSGRLVVEPPITLKNSDGTDTEEVASILRGEFSEKLKKRLAQPNLQNDPAR